MSVMEKMRSGTDSTIMQVILALVVISFVFLFGSPQGGDMGQTVATVNGVPIQDHEFSRAYRNAERQYDRNLGEAERENLRAQVKKGLIEQEIVLQEATRLGLAVSDREVARQLLEIPVFHDKDGGFDDDRYSRWLRSQGFTQSGFEDQLRKDLLRTKLRNLVFMGATVSEPVIREFFVEQNTRVDVEHVRLRPAAFEDDVVVTPEERATWLAENAERVQQRYELDKNRLYDIPDKLELAVIRLEKKDDGEDVRARIDQLRAELDQGADFGQHARRWSEDPSALGDGQLGELAAPTLSQDVRLAVTDLQPGGVSEVVEDDRQVRLFKLLAKQEGRLVPLEEVRDDVVGKLMAEERAPALAAAFAEELLAAWKDRGAVPQEMLDAQGLMATPTGMISIRPEPGPFSPPAKLVGDAGKADVGAVLPEVYQQGDAYWVGQLVERQDPDMDLYRDEQELLREQVLMQRRSEFYQGWVDDLVARATVK